MNRKKLQRQATKTLTSKDTAQRATFFLIGAAGAVGGFLIGRRRNLAARAKGLAHEMRPDSSTGSLNDPGLASKVESEIFRDSDVPKGDVLVNAENGVVFLRGQVETDDHIEALVTAAARVDGVTAVESLLHLPGTPAPMKS